MNEMGVGEGNKKRKFGHPSGPHPSRPHPSGATLGSPTPKPPGASHDSPSARTQHQHRQKWSGGQTQKKCGPKGSGWVIADCKSFNDWCEGGPKGGPNRVWPPLPRFRVWVWRVWGPGQNASLWVFGVSAFWVENLAETLKHKN